MEGVHHLTRRHLRGSRDEGNPTPRKNATARVAPKGMAWTRKPARAGIDITGIQSGPHALSVLTLDTRKGRARALSGAKAQGRYGQDVLLTDLGGRDLDDWLA